MTLPQPPKCPSILDELNRNANQMRVVWDALVKERDDLRAQIEGFTAERSTFAVEAQKMREERDSLRSQVVHLHQLLTNASVVTSDGHGRGYDLASRINILVQQRDLAFNGKENAQRDAFQYADALKIELDAAKRELDALKNRPPQVNTAGDPIAQILTLLGLKHIVVPPSGPLPQELINALENINLNLEIAANTNLTGMTHSLVPKDELADLLKAKHILDHIRTLGM